MSTLVIADAQLFRKTLSHYPTGVCIIAARGEDGNATGMTVGTFTSVSLDPPLVGFLPAKSSESWRQIQGIGRFCANILSSGQGHVCRRFAARIDDKFDGVEYHLSPGGQPILDEAIAWVDCIVHAVQEAGDHYFVLGRVNAHGAIADVAPLLFFKGEFGEFRELPALGTDLNRGSP